MNIRYSFVNCTVNEELKAYIEKKVGRVTHHFKRLVDIHVIVKKERQNYTSELIVSGDGRKFYLNATTDALNSSIDLLADKAEAQVLKFEKKRRDYRLKKSGLKYKKEQNKEIGISGSVDAIDTKDFYIKPMSLIEASLELELMKSNFLLFPEAKSMMLYFIYKDKSGLYGVIRRPVSFLSRLARVFGYRKHTSNFVNDLVDIKNERIKFVERKRLDIREVSREAALNEFINSGYKFYIFTDADTKETNVIFREDKNNFGLFEIS